MTIRDSLNFPSSTTINIRFLQGRRIVASWRKHLMDEVDKLDKSSRCGEKRKAPKQQKSQVVEKSQKKPWGTNGPPPPEWIEMMREKKVARMAEKEKKRIELGLPDPKAEPVDTFNHNVITRPMLRLPESKHSDSERERITIMTYNVLAQSLIRRRLFPTSGDTLKWKNRSKMLTKELTHYQPTILCMQEVDLEQYEPYFIKLLHTLKYDHVLLAAKKKRQGLLVAWKDTIYDLIHRKDIHYDTLNAGNVGPTMWTGNLGLCLGLKRKDSTGKGIWVSNTHLYWHPRGSYERQRQAGILVSESLNCTSTQPSWPVFICGDFNSTPNGMTYTALTQRPIQLTPYQQEELHGSVTYDFRQVKDEEEELAEDSDLTPAGAITPADSTDVEITNTDSNATESSTTPIWKTREYLTQRLLVQEEKPLNITPASMENNALVLKHHSSNPPLKSLYSAGLKLCQSDNAVNGFGEPPFTNWAHGYKETLDYIFVLDDQLTEEKVRLSALLKMPRKEEMKEGEPQEGRFPSDHVCEMVEVELL